MKIAASDSYKKHLNQHNVIYIDCSRLPDLCNSYESYIEYVKNNIYEDIEEQYNLSKVEGKTVSDVLKATENSFVFILDEWDSIFYKDFMKQADKVS